MVANSVKTQGRWTFDTVSKELSFLNGITKLQYSADISNSHTEDIFRFITETIRRRNIMNEPHLFHRNDIKQLSRLFKKANIRGARHCACCKEPMFLLSCQYIGLYGVDDYYTKKGIAIPIYYFYECTQCKYKQQYRSSDGFLHSEEKLISNILIRNHYPYEGSYTAMSISLDAKGNRIFDKDPIILLDQKEPFDLGKITERNLKYLLLFKN